MLGTERVAPAPAQGMANWGVWVEGIRVEGSSCVVQEVSFMLDVMEHRDGDGEMAPGGHIGRS